MILLSLLKKLKSSEAKKEAHKAEVEELKRRLLKQPKNLKSRL
jgi:hypothetical protein